MKSAKLASEWYLYSTGMIVLAALFIVTYFFQGTQQNFGYAITAVVTFIFGSSAKWKNQPAGVHLSVIALGIVFVVLLAIRPFIDFCKRVFK